RAGLASDTRVALIVERQHGDVFLFQIAPDLFVSPQGEGADLAKGLPARELERLHGLKVSARRRLLAAEAGEPRFVIRQTGEERLDFTESAAAIGSALVEDPVLLLLVGNGLLRAQV